MHRVLDEPRLARFVDLFGAAIVKGHVDAVLARVRAGARDGEPVPAEPALFDAILVRLAREEERGLLPVLNGTGILLHTNLGRAPLAPEALAAMVAAGSGYSNLEYDLEAGERGSRYARVSALLREAGGAEDGIVVNNCAAAVLLILDTFAKGREVVVARGELVEIGGGFRLPDVLRRSGARLVEVGATNKTYADDFARALTPDTGLLLRTHASNFRIEGFTAEVRPADLAALGRRAGVVVVEDLGSGAVADLTRWGLPHERTVRDAIADGIDLVAFSGDKLLGGPQAGIIAGRSALVARLRANPLLRALRVDKATLAALAATLRLHLEPGDVERIPLYAMLAASVTELHARAEAVAHALRAAGCDAAPIDATAYVGGGSLPLHAVSSAAVALRPRAGDAAACAARLRGARPPLVARVADGRVVVDLRTIPPERDADVRALLLAAA